VEKRNQDVVIDYNLETQVERVEGAGGE